MTIVTCTNPKASTPFVVNMAENTFDFAGTTFRMGPNVTAEKFVLDMVMNGHGWACDAHISHTPNEHIAGHWDFTMADGGTMSSVSRVLSIADMAEIEREIAIYAAEDAKDARFADDDDPDADGYGWERRALSRV